MKIFAFNTTEDTRVEILWSLKSQNRDAIFAKFIADCRYTETNSLQNCDLAIYPHKAFTPETLSFNRDVFSAAEFAQAKGKPIIIDATSDSDVLLDIPSANILRCGLYKSLKKPFETECPYWSNDRTKQRLDKLAIRPKGSKPVVGFCGTTASIGKLANLSKDLIPSAITKTVLGQGKLARQTDPRIVEGMSLQLRESAIQLLAGDRQIETAFEVTNNHKSYYFKDETNKIALENLFITSTECADYVLCIRGSGNYSGRFYMALNAGRIPVVIDTDVVIPYEDRLAIIKIPVEATAHIGEIILEHFHRTSDAELRAMKRQNRWAYHQFLAPEKFLTRFISQCVRSKARSHGVSQS